MLAVLDLQNSEIYPCLVSPQLVWGTLRGETDKLRSGKSKLAMQLQKHCEGQLA